MTSFYKLLLLLFFFQDEGDETYLGTFNTGKDSADVDGTENVDFDAYDDDKEHNNFDNKDEQSDEDYSSDNTDPALSFCYDKQSELPEPLSDPSNLCI